MTINSKLGNCDHFSRVGIAEQRTQQTGNTSVETFVKLDSKMLCLATSLFSHLFPTPFLDQKTKTKPTRQNSRVKVEKQTLLHSRCCTLFLFRPDALFLVAADTSDGLWRRRSLL